MAVAAAIAVGILARGRKEWREQRNKHMAAWKEKRKEWREDHKERRRHQKAGDYKWKPEKGDKKVDGHEWEPSDLEKIIGEHSLIVLLSETSIIIPAFPGCYSVAADLYKVSRISMQFSFNYSLLALEISPHEF